MSIIIHKISECAWLIVKLRFDQLAYGSTVSIQQLITGCNVNPRSCQQKQVFFEILYLLGTKSVMKLANSGGSCSTGSNKSHKVTTEPIGLSRVTAENFDKVSVIFALRVELYCGYLDSIIENGRGIDGHTTRHLSAYITVTCQHVKMYDHGKILTSCVQSWQPTRPVCGRRRQEEAQ